MQDGLCCQRDSRIWPSQVVVPLLSSGTLASPALSAHHPPCNSAATDTLKLWQWRNDTPAACTVTWLLYCADVWLLTQVACMSTNYLGLGPASL